MSVTQKEKSLLRALAAQYIEIATQPEQAETIQLWRALNRGAMERPMVCIDQLPWNELTDEILICEVQDPFWRNIEWDLRTSLYQHRHFSVDRVLEPFIRIPYVVENHLYGITPKLETLGTNGITILSQHFSTCLQEDSDVDLIRDMIIQLDTAASTIRIHEALDIFDGVAPVYQAGGVVLSLGIWEYLAQWMHPEDVLINLMDRPEFIHACLRRITDATLAGICSMNTQRLFDGNAGICHCSHIYCDDLAPAPLQNNHFNSNNVWTMGLAQLLTSVSPAMFQEFELPYICELSQHFGAIYYGCCDRLDDRLEFVKSIPNVRKVSCSPWSNRENFIKNIGTSLVMSYKPNPALLASDVLDEAAIRKDLQETVELARAHQVNLEFILKDVSTVNHHPSHIDTWARIAMETVQA